MHSGKFRPTDDHTKDTAGPDRVLRENIRRESLQTSCGGRIGRKTQDGKDIPEGREEGDEVRALGIDRWSEGEEKAGKGQGQHLGVPGDEAPSPLIGIECTEYM